VYEYLSQARSTRKQGGPILYERSDAHRCFATYLFNPCLRVLVAWDKYHRESETFTGATPIAMNNEQRTTKSLHILTYRYNIFLSLKRCGEIEKNDRKNKELLQPSEYFSRTSLQLPFQPFSTRRDSWLKNYPTESHSKSRKINIRH